MDTINVFCKYNDTRSLHKELTNILLLCTEESNYYYCYCDIDNRITCSLCQFCQFLPDAKIENLSCRNFLQLNYAKREKLDIVVSLISPFFNRIKSEKEAALDFLIRNTTGIQEISTGDVKFVSLDEIIESDKQLVKDNPLLFNLDGN